VVVAIVFSTVALLALSVLPRFSGSRFILGRVTGSALMGLAIVLMHYTGMFATRFYPEPGPAESGAFFNPSIMVATIAIVSLLIVGLALSAALFDRRAERAEGLVQDAVDSISEGFVIYDADGRLVTCNDSYRHLYSGDAAYLVPGVSFEETLRHGLTLGMYPDAVGREAEWLGAWLKLHRECSGAIEQPLADGRWVLVTKRRMRSGGVAGLRIDITALKRAQAALLDSEVRLERAQEIAGIGSWELDLATGEYIWSKQLYRIRGLPPDYRPTLDNMALNLQADDARVRSEWLADLRSGRERGPVEITITPPDGEPRVLRIEGRAVIDADGGIRRLTGTTQDVTDRRKIEQQLAQAQKMQTVGQLTGGLAHDFNNILGAVIGNLDLVAEHVASDTEVAGYCSIALDAALSAAELVKRLLAFSRRQALRPRPTNLDDAIANVLPLVKRTLGEQIRIETELASHLWPAVADPVQLESAILNLTLNARDAMPGGGTLAIRAANARIDEGFAVAGGDLQPGEYVVIAVSDTGTGMCPEVLAHVFEPFFTTKPPGAGSGLGLSMVFGTMQQLGGTVRIDSEAGVGTTVRLYLPRALDQWDENGNREDDSERSSPTGREHILLVEDNDQIRTLGTNTLRGLGYLVTVATSGDDAMKYIECGARFDLVFTDIVMPGGIDGLALAARVRARDPSARILFTSGFSSPVTLREQIDEFDAELIAKPYRKTDLALLVRAVLNKVPEVTI
jgi:signal transduction histidine kinase/CheY-like chemotaxis protein